MLFTYLICGIAYDPWLQRWRQWTLFSDNFTLLFASICRFMVSVHSVLFLVFPRTFNKSCNRSVYWPSWRKQVHWPTSTLGSLLPSTAPSPSSWPIALTHLSLSITILRCFHPLLAKSTGRALLLRHSLLLCPSSIRGSRKYRWFARRIKDVTKFHRATVSVRSPAKHKQCFW